MEKIDDIGLEDIVQAIQPLDEDLWQKAKEHSERLIMPPRALGRLHEIAERVCAIQGCLQPEVGKKTVLVFAGDHGVVQEGISAFPQVVSLEMIRCFLQGGAGINALSREVGAEVRVVDMGIIPDLDAEDLPGGELLQVCKQGRGTRNFALEPAMDREQARECILTGFRVASKWIQSGTRLLGTGDMGIGNTTPAAAMGAVFTGCEPELMAGPGTGLEENGVQHKARVIEKVLRLHQPQARDALDVLSKVGGFEIGGIAGCILAGAYYRVPVVIDGFISTAGALLAQALQPRIREYMFAGHCSQESGHRIMLQHLDLEPILCLDMRLGEGTGGVLSMGIIQAAVRVFNEVFTFEQGGVSEKQD
ncbi:MAG: nicotinate-nucleotide--dimethylbenzimidazole phosphoribosyltransferase [Desulfohalobiaceae bacterium]